MIEPGEQSYPDIGREGGEAGLRIYLEQKTERLDALPRNVDG
jgi:hypothetical protein